MRLKSLQQCGAAADISWPPPPLQKQSVKAVVFWVPEAVAGASGAYQVSHDKK